MAAKALARGMGTFYKDCEPPASRWATCPHFYKVRYRGPGGEQVAESGFLTQDEAIDRLTSVCKAKKAARRTRTTPSWASSRLSTTPSKPSSRPLRSSRPCAVPGTTCSDS